MNYKVVIVIAGFIALVAIVIVAYKLIIKLVSKNKTESVYNDDNARQISDTAVSLPLRDVVSQTAVMKDGTAVTAIEIDLKNEDLLSWDDWDKANKKRAAALSGANLPFLILRMQRPADTASELQDLHRRLNRANIELSHLSSQSSDRFERRKLQQTKKRVELLEQAIADAEKDSKLGGATKSHAYIIFGLRSQNASRVVADEAAAMLMRFENAGYSGRVLYDDRLVRIFMDNNGSYPSMSENTRTSQVSPQIVRPDYYSIDEVQYV